MIAPPDPFMPEPAPRKSYDDDDASGLLVTVADVAELLGIGRTDCWRMVRAGFLTPDFMTTGGEALFLPAKVAAINKPVA